MPDIPFTSEGGPATDDTSGQAASSIGVAITNSGVANTKSAWTQIVASTARGWQGVGVFLSQASLVANSSFLIDIGVGAAASEIAVVSNLLVSNGSGRDLQAPILIPISIPSGTRVSARFQSTSTTTTLRVSFVFFTQGAAGGVAFQQVETCGAVTGTSTGTTVDPGAVLNTKGSWTQLIASTTFAYKAMFYCLGQAAQATRPNAGWLIDLGVGAAASEVVAVGNLAHSVESGNLNIYPKIFGPFPVSIPAGTRLACRAQCSSTTATQRTFDITAYGIG